MRLLSRNAECLFWLARYLERVASLARIVEMQSSFGGYDRDRGWNWLLTLHTDEARFRERFEPAADTIIAFYLTDAANPGSIRSSTRWARENARALRPFIPLEMWAQLNVFHGMIERVNAEDIRLSQLPRTCAQIRAGCLAQIGIAESTLYRDEGYEFFKLGLMIERADQTSRLLDVKFAQNATTGTSTDQSDDFVFWSTILRTAAAYQVFHRLEPAGADAQRVARFLVFNPSHPRAIGFCVRSMTDALEMLRRGFGLHTTNVCLEACELLTEGLHTAARDPALHLRLHEFNDWVQQSLIGLTAEIDNAFFRKRMPALAAESTDAPTGSKAPPVVAPVSQSQKQTQTQTRDQKQS